MNASSASLKAPAAGELDRVANREFFDVYVPLLPLEQQRVIARYLGGETPSQIAAGEGVTRQTVHNRLSSAIAEIRLRAFTRERD